MFFYLYTNLCSHESLFSRKGICYAICTLRFALLNTYASAHLTQTAYHGCALLFMLAADTSGFYPYTWRAQKIGGSFWECRSKIAGVLIYSLTKLPPPIFHFQSTSLTWFAAYFHRAIYTLNKDLERRRRELETKTRVGETCTWFWLQIWGDRIHWLTEFFSSAEEVVFQVYVFLEYFPDIVHTLAHRVVQYVRILHMCTQLLQTSVGRIVLYRTCWKITSLYIA